jgi:hypothetical protein
MNRSYKGIEIVEVKIQKPSYQPFAYVGARHGEKQGGVITRYKAEGFQAQDTLRDLKILIDNAIGNELTPKQKETKLFANVDIDNSSCCFEKGVIFENGVCLNEVYRVIARCEDAIRIHPVSNSNGYKYEVKGSRKADGLYFSLTNAKKAISASSNSGWLEYPTI